MRQKNSKIRITVLGLSVFITALFGLFISQHQILNKNHDLSRFHGTLLEKPRNLSEFTLLGSDNKPFNNDSLNGHWTMAFFGFTSCGSICPTIMAELSKMYNLLESKGQKSLPNIVMISLDPKRDTLDKLASYVKAFHPSFYGASGDEVSLNKLTAEVGIAYAKITKKDDENSEGYDIEHTGTLILLNPKGEIAAFFTTPHNASLLAEDYMMLDQNT